MWEMANSQDHEEAAKTPMVWGDTRMPCQRGKNFHGALSRDTVAGHPSPRAIMVTHLRLESISTVPGAVGLDTNGVSAGNRSLLELRLVRTQEVRQEEQDCHQMADEQQNPEGVLAICHFR